MQQKFFNATDLRALGGDWAALADAIRERRKTSVFGLGWAEKALVAAHVGAPLLFVAKDEASAGRLTERIAEWLPEGRVAYLPPKDDVLIYRKRFQSSALAERMSVLVRLAEGRLDCCVTSAQSLVQYVPQRERLIASAASVAVGGECDPVALAEKLTALGYIRCDAAEEKNTFALHGDILSVFPPDRERPLRISFFGDEVESIKTFDPETMSSLAVENRLDFMPAGDVFATSEEVRGALAAAKKVIAKTDGHARDRLDAIVAELEAETSIGQTFQWLLPWLAMSRFALFDYLPDGAYVFVADPSGVAAKLELYLREHRERVKALAVDGEVLGAHMNCLAAADEALARLTERGVTGFIPTRSTNRVYSAERAFSPAFARVEDYSLNVQKLYSDLTNYMHAGYAVALCMGDRARAQSIAMSLKDNDIPCRVSDDVDLVPGTLTATPIALSYGFCLPGIKFVAIGMRDISRSRTVRSAASGTWLFTLPRKGDYVVHEVHGIGRCLGIEKIEFQGIMRDYVVIEYRDGGLLQVPIDQLDRLSRYSGSERVPRLSKLGGKEFEKIKKDVYRSVKKMAIDLAALYAERESRKGYRYEPDTDDQKRFEDAFPYEETPDQLRAVAEIKEDMESGRVMDRLLCGDVGYGKTEVAFRAIFKTVIEAKQAVILAPTTLLATQHYKTACERFRDFGIDIELLTRFRSPDLVRASLDRVKSGAAHLVIGTHRLLSKDVEFNDLGLIVLDEEQRFGVEHKEKLKVLKPDVNVLTLSATPIPRTLNMAMTGIRDISVLETPPTSRIPVQTYVTELTDALLRDALMRELARGGQAFILYNRVDGIENFAQKVKTIGPEARVVVGHGQMEQRALEENVGAFYARTVDVLVCTTIIENGIDVPDANTLIVCDADRLGLAQLYQLRGRVGRRNRLAYAYFTTPEGKVLTEDASKRLTAIMDFTEFGSGFRIAMRDLEIRGAGTILGREQHGHIEKVGYDLYCKMLAKSVEEVRSGKTQEEEEPELSVKLDAYLDQGYVGSVDERLKILKAISALASAEEAWELVQTLSDAYGKPPKPLLNLIDLGLVKNLARKARVKRVFVTDRAAEIVFRDASGVRNEKTIGALASMSGKCTLVGDEEPKVVFDCRYDSNENKFALIAEFLRKCV